MIKQTTPEFEYIEDRERLEILLSRQDRYAGYTIYTQKEIQQLDLPALKNEKNICRLLKHKKGSRKELDSLTFEEVDKLVEMLDNEIETKLNEEIRKAISSVTQDNRPVKAAAEIYGPETAFPPIEQEEK